MELEKLYTLSHDYLITKYQTYHRDYVKNHCFKHRLPILIGQRGVGKTTSIVQYLLDSVEQNTLSNSILYIPVDHFLLGSTPLYNIAEAFNHLGGKIIAFDEIHKYANWSNELKSMYDTFPKLQIIASGSSALEIHKGSHDLTRRSAIYSIKGFSFREYLELTTGSKFPPYPLEKIINDHRNISEKVLKKIHNHNKKILAEFNDYLRIGYYPYFTEFNDEAIYHMTLEQNFHMTIESDLTAIYPSLTGNSIKKIKQLLSYLAATIPSTTSLNKLKSLIGIADERTLKTYFKYLEDAELIRLVMKTSNKLRKLELPEKIYLDNTNELYAIAKRGHNKGTVRELFFLNMLDNKHYLTISNQGDFLVDNKITFEIGGKSKDCSQIKNVNSAYLACDGIEMGYGNKIPLWLFGFIY